MSFSITTNQQITEYYNRYRENEILFTKDIMRFLRMDPRQVYLKCAGSQWPCIINSTSFQQAKIIVGTSGGAFQQITKKDAPPVNLRYCFIEPDNQPLIFFVTCRVTDVTPYMNSHDLAIITLSFTQRPPDDLILKLGVLLDANEGFMNRKEERIILNEDTKRILGIPKKESIILIQNVPRRCILWNLSFSGAKVVVLGVPKFLQNKDCIIRLLFSEPNEIIDVKGTIVSSVPVQGRQDLAEAGIKFDENQVPLAYKIRINDYLSNRRKKFLDASTKIQDNEQPTDIDAQKKALAEKVAAARAANMKANDEAEAKKLEEEAARRAKRYATAEERMKMEEEEAAKEAAAKAEKEKALAEGAAPAAESEGAAATENATPASEAPAAETTEAPATTETAAEPAADAPESKAESAPAENAAPANNAEPAVNAAPAPAAN